MNKTLKTKDTIDSNPSVGKASNVYLSSHKEEHYKSFTHVEKINSNLSALNLLVPKRLTNQNNVEKILQANRDLKPSKIMVRARSDKASSKIMYKPMNKVYLHAENVSLPPDRRLS